MYLRGKTKIMNMQGDARRTLMSFRHHQRILRRFYLCENLEKNRSFLIIIKKKNSRIY